MVEKPHAGDKVTFLQDVHTNYGIRHTKGYSSRIVKVTTDMRGVPFIIVRDPHRFDFSIEIPIDKYEEVIDVEYGGQRFYDRYDRYEE